MGGGTGGISSNTPIQPLILLVIMILDPIHYPIQTNTANTKPVEGSEPDWPKVDG